MILVIDNYDSFTYNLVQLLAALGAEVRVERNDALSAADALALAPAGSLVWLLLRTTQVRDGAAPPTEQYSWVPAFGLQLDFSLSSLQWILAVLVTGVGTLILGYCTWYFREDDPGLWRFGAVFTYFAGAMLGLVLSDNIVLLCIFPEIATWLPSQYSGA